MMPTLELADVEQIVQLLDRATDPTKNLLQPDRRRNLIEGLVRLVDADMWIWSMTALNHDLPGDAMTTCVIDGGWKSSQEQDRVYEVLSSPEFNTRGMQSAYQSITRCEQVTLSHGEVFPPAEADQLTEIWRSTGFEFFLLSLHPLQGNFSSNLGVHRRRGKPNFGPRENTIVHTVFHGVDWLHRYGVHEAAGKSAVQLSPRERQSLILMLSGCTNPEMARRMGITAHTVKDYVRRVHKRFGVGSRSELQAYFFLGTPDRRSHEVDLGE